MQVAEVLLALAGIAGVFVGFGALISLTGGTAGEGPESMYIRGVVTVGIMVILTALVPVIISLYAITGHQLWLMSALVFLVFNWLDRSGTAKRAIVMNQRRPEYRAFVESSIVILSVLLLEVPLNAALALVVIGALPDLDAALYATAVMLLLAQAGFFLTQVVYSSRRPRAA